MVVRGLLVYTYFLPNASRMSVAHRACPRTVIVHDTGAATSCIEPLNCIGIELQKSHYVMSVLLVDRVLTFGGCRKRWATNTGKIRGCLLVTVSHRNDHQD